MLSIPLTSEGLEMDSTPGGLQCGRGDGRGSWRTKRGGGRKHHCVKSKGRGKDKGKHTPIA